MSGYADWTWADEERYGGPLDPREPDWTWRDEIDVDLSGEGPGDPDEDYLAYLDSLTPSD